MSHQVKAEGRKRRRKNLLDAGNATEQNGCKKEPQLQS